MPYKNTTKKTTGVTPESFKKKLGARVRKIRKDNKMTQTEFGDAIGIAYYEISRYERGKDEMSVYVAMRICNRFNIAIEDFLNGLDKEIEYAETESS